MENVIVITGGSRGIGAATALLAARQGYRICINYHADGQAAEDILGQVRALGSEAIAVRADVSVEDEIIQLFQRVDDELGPVTALVNNAGTISQQSRVEDMSEFRLLKVMKTNVVGPMLCAKHALLRMARRHGGQGGAIVNVSSVAARLGSPNEYVDYAASKAHSIPSPLAWPKRWQARACGSMAYARATFTPASMRCPVTRTASAS